MQVLIPDYIASERQAKFHSSPCFETLYGGAAGGGKTRALCAEAITSALEQEGTHVYIFRRTLKELMQSVYIELLGQLAAYQNIPDDKKATLPNGKPLTISYNSQRSIFQFTNGSFIQLAYLDSIADRYNYQSAEIHVLLIDELTHFLEDDYEYLKTRVRAANRRVRVMAATNPGNIGHGWVKNRFIVSKDPGVHYTPEQPYTDPATGLQRIFIPAKVDDNPNESFKESYKKVLNAIQDTQLRKALYFGDWDVFEGQVYLEWDKDRHVLPYLPVPLEVCKKYIGFDWGYNDHACATWFAVAPENEYGVKHIYAYREIYERQQTPQWWAKQIQAIIQDEPIEYMVLPHDCFSHLGGNQTIARTFGDYDIPFVRADSMSHAAKMHRIALMHQLLAISDDDKPYLQYLAVCANNIRTIPDLPYSETRPEEISDKAEDHAFDSSTYGLMVIMDSEAWIVGNSKEHRKRESFLGEIGPQYDIHNAIRKTQIEERDWKYL